MNASANLLQKVREYGSAVFVQKIWSNGRWLARTWCFFPVHWQRRPVQRHLRRRSEETRYVKNAVPPLRGKPNKQKVMLAIWTPGRARNKVIDGMIQAQLRSGFSNEKSTLNDRGR